MQVEAMSLKVLSRCRRKWGKVLKPPPRRMSGIGGWGVGCPAVGSLAARRCMGREARCAGAAA